MSVTHAQAPEAEEINLKQLLAALGRRWPFILAGIALGGLVAARITSVTKTTWEGSFEIVVASKNQGGSLNSLTGINPMLANLAGLSGSGAKGELETEVKILESVSVLKPVFDEVRARKAALGEDMTSYSFKTWARNLTIELEKGTSVLIISYRDTNQSLILQVLRSLSATYQNYSIRERNESLKNALKFADEQARIYRERSDASFRALNSFGLTYGIASKSTGGSGAGLDISKLLSPYTSSAALNLSGGSYSSINPSRGSSSSFKPNGADPLAQLAQLNQELIRQQQTFTTNDPSVTALMRERDAVRRFIESSAFGSIAYPGKQAISKEQAQSILTRHQELERKANRDQSTLDSMESALLSLQLEQARASTPWQLISTPTLLERPVAPRPARNLAIGLVSGILLGCAAALIADQRSGRIFNKEQLKELLPTQLLLELSSDQAHTWNDGLRLLGLRKAQGGSLAILPLGEVERSQMNRIRDILKQTCNTRIEICRTTLEASEFDKQLLMAAPGSIKKSHLDRLIQELSLQRTPILGWIWLDSESVNA